MGRKVPIIIDMQKDFCKPGFAFDGPEVDMKPVQEAVERTGKFLKEYRENGGTPIIVRTAHGPDIDSEPWKNKYDSEMPCRKGTEGAELMPSLNVQEEDVVIEKNGFDAFQDTELDETLKRMDADEVVLAGVMTNVCVEYTAQSAFNHGYEVTVLRDLTDSIYPGKRKESLEKMSNIFASIKNSERLSR